jgi:predicted sugar kinase
VPVEDDATREFSPMVARVRLPSAWRCVVIIGRDAVGLAGDAEKAAFKSLPPVPQEVSAELARIALLELLPAAVEGKFAEFSAAVRAYGTLAGKPFEEASRQLPYAAATEHLLELLGELGAVGSAQSSWGPAVMACCESLDAAGELIDGLETLDLARHHEITIARFDPQGATLRVLE